MRNWAAWAGTEGTRLECCCPRWGRSRPTPGASATCTAVSGSGARRSSQPRDIRAPKVTAGLTCAPVDRQSLLVGKVVIRGGAWAYSPRDGALRIPHPSACRYRQPFRRNPLRDQWPRTSAPGWRARQSRSAAPPGTGSHVFDDAHVHPVGGLLRVHDGCVSQRLVPRQLCRADLSRSATTGGRGGGSGGGTGARVPSASNGGSCWCGRRPKRAPSPRVSHSHHLDQEHIRQMVGR